MSRPLALLIGALLLASTLTRADADGADATVSSAAVVTAQAESVFHTNDVISVYNRTNQLLPDVQSSAIGAALEARGVFALGRGASIGMVRVRRDGALVQEAPNSFQFPMSVSVLPLQAVGALMGRDVAGVLARGFIVMSKTTAQIRGAQVGDTVDLVGADGGIYTLGVGMVADDAVVGGSELLIGPDQADVLGITVVSRIVLWGFASREAIEAQLAASGLTARADTRVRRSWDAFDPDSTLSLADTKVQLGEFAYRVNANGTDVSVTQDWAAANIPPDREVLYAPIPINARCHRVIKADLIAALAEVDAAGLAGAIDVGNANAFGGCYYPRFSRTSGALGFLSRHSWGQALDTNTIANAQGRAPTMNCAVVRIFRKHNFAWGGNFLTPDGMHFEWVGERRDQLQYPSRYCPNLPSTTSTENVPAPSPAVDSIAHDGRATIFANDGWSGD